MQEEKISEPKPKFKDKVSQDTENENKKQQITPAMEQYLYIKAQYRDCILLFRIGDFYEMFYEDAVIASKVLNIALTSRDGNTPMAGFPYHAADNYIARLVKEGFKVAICEQLEEPSKSKKIVKRGVVRIITPGVITELSYISPEENNFICSIYKNSMVWADITTGEVKAGVFQDEFEMHEYLRKISPREVLSDTNLFPQYRFTKIEFPDENEAEKIIEENTEASEQKIKEMQPHIKICFAALISYIKENIKDISINLELPEIERKDGVMFIDFRTSENIELLSTYEGRKGSLLWALDRTKTPMGKRKLKDMILSPLTTPEKISERLDAVEELINKKAWEIIDLQSISDMERLTIRLMRKISNPREIISLKNSAKVVEEVKKRMESFESQLLRKIKMEIPDLEKFIEFCEKHIVEPPPLRASDGAIKKGVSQELDSLRELKENSQKILKEIEEKEKRETGIPLKIGYNQVFGYYIEISKTYMQKVPSHYKRKQTLANYERYITDELEKIGMEIETAEEREKKLNEELFSKFLMEAAERFGNSLLKSARAIAYLDVLLSFAESAYFNEWVKPIITEEKAIQIKDGRHPSIEIMLKEKDEQFIPNSLELDENEKMWIITGPNMSGKSVFLKQSALITLMAHIGSFVPAKEAKIGIVDRIFFRTGTSDDIARGRSTFYVEMEELSSILNNMTERSFVLLDEVGRGTSTFDGICIAWATAEYILKRNVRCVFATHFHELSFLERNFDGVRNMHFSAEKIGGNLVFVRRIKRGAAGKSWGIDVARLAGIPQEIVEKAEKILIALEKGKLGDVIKKVADIPLQLSIFKTSKEQDDSIRRELKKIDINKITPVEAIAILAELKNMAEK